MEPPLADWTSYLDSVHPPGLRPPILASGQRPPQTNLDREQGNSGLRRVSQEDLSHRLRSSGVLLSAANPHLEWISALLADVPHVVSLVDADGIVLKSLGTPDDLRSLGLAPGYDWSEAAMGTNGAGTALVTNQPVAVVRRDDDNPPFHDCTCTAAPIHAPDGRVIGALDISMPADHAGPERLLLAAHSALVIDQAIYASAQIEQAESLRLLALLSSFTAHELVNPLSALKTILELLAQKRLKGEPAKMVSAACGNAERLLQVVEELRILGGSHDRRMQRIELGSLVRDAVDRAACAARVEIESTLATDENWIDCNPSLLSRALYNLLDNAHHAAGEDGRIGIRIEATTDAKRLTVWDTGLGVSHTAVPKLFHESFTTKPGGSGLGLLLTRVIVEQVHGGRLKYLQNQPHGARFTIELPSKQAAAPTARFTDFCG